MTVASGAVDFDNPSLGLVPWTAGLTGANFMCKDVCTQKAN